MPPAASKIPAVAGESEWAMKPTEKMKYDQLFDSLNPANGFIPGSKVGGNFSHFFKNEILNL